MNATFVGRREEAGELLGLLARAAGGRGGVGIVRGEAGVGKTSLVEHVLGQSAGDGNRLAVWARCRESGAPPLWPWQQIARAASRMGIGGLEILTAETAGVPAASLQQTSSGQDRFQRFDAMAQCLLAASALQPIVYVLDDLQWADDDSLELLSFVAGDIATSRVAVMATVRTGEPAASRRLDDALRPTGNDVRVDVGGLADDDLAQLLGATLGDRPPAAVVREVGAHTGGNPFFASEVARLMRASGTAHDPGSWRGVLPEGVRAVLGRRLARLPRGAHTLLGPAAVLGSDFDAETLSKLAGADPSDVLNELDAAIDAGLVTPTGDGRFRFGHALVRDAAASELPASSRRDLHQRAAAVLTEQAGTEAAAEIADHHMLAGDTAESARWSLVAGRQAALAGMYAEAAAWLERALQSSPALPAAERASVLIEFAAAAARAGRTADSSAAYGEAARLARQCDDADLLGRAALGIGTIGGSFEIQLLDTAHHALVEEALERLPSGDSTLRSWLLARLSVATSLRSDDARRRELAEEAVGVATRLGDDAAIAHALGAYCDSIAGPAHLAERIEGADAMLSAAIRSGDPELELLARRFQIIAHMELGNVAVASRHITAFVALADRLRQPQFRWYARTLEGMLAHLRGDLDLAERLSAAAIADGRQAGSANMQMIVDGGLAPVLARDRGDPELCRKMFQRAIAEHHEANRGIDPSPLLVLAYTPDRDDVRRTLDQIPPGGPMGENEAVYLQGATMSAEGWAYLGERDRAEHVAATLERFADIMVLDGWASVCYGPVSLFLGRVAAHLGQTERARHWFNQALAKVVPLQAPLLEADIRERIARLAGASTTPRPRPQAAVFERDGELWRVAFNGTQAHFSDAKGIQDLARLLAQPNREIHVLDLVGAGADVVPRHGSAGPVLDVAARRAYEQRIRDLTGDLEEAEANNDLGRAARLEDERDQLLRELSRSLGLGGRERDAVSDPAERARKAVGMRIRSSIDKIERELPELGRHLRHAVRTGVYCTYQPEHPVDWRV